MTVLALLLITRTNAISAQANPPVKNIVIVHGAFAEASGWEAVYKTLKKDHYQDRLQ